MLGVGQPFPQFSLKAVVSAKPDRAFTTVSNKDFSGKWQVYFFWPKDFTFVCPTEIIEFGKKDNSFKEKNAQLIGASIDSEFVHLAWRESNKDLGESPFPWLSDIKRELSQSLGILDQHEGVPLRATYIVDPEGIIRHVSVNDLSVGRNVDETLRVLEALQTGELCPCNWNPGEPTL